MIRKIIKIDEDKCNGCGLCVAACHEGAIGMEGGKAKLLRDDYCDGLGDCLPACPTNAITFIEREALAYDEEAVKMNMQKNSQKKDDKLPCGCPGTNAKTINKKDTNSPYVAVSTETIKMESELNQWPVQIKLVPTNAPYFRDAHLLIAADCTAFSYGNFHHKFMKNKITLIGCPKLDNIDYSEKLRDILKVNNIKSITVIRMEVPCCGGITNAVINALKESEKIIPWQVVTVSTSGEIIL